MLRSRTIPMASLFDSILDPEVQKLLRRERELLVELRETLEREQADEKQRIDELLESLDDLFRIVVVGEFNAGKSSLINALFGQRLRREGPVPVDDRISILRWGPEEASRPLSEFVAEQTYPVELLRNLTLIDTPGTNSIVTRHQEITEDFVPRADLVLFVTSIDRPLSESERQFLGYIREWGRKVVFVLSKIDTKNDDEVAEVIEYIRTHVSEIFGFDPAIFPVAAKAALEAKLGEADPRAWTQSGFERFEDYVFRVLSEGERLRLKLMAPLDTVEALGRKQRERIESRRRILATDMAKIVAIREQLALAERDIGANFEKFVLRIDNMMMDLERRGVAFLERYVRIQHVMMLRDATRFRDEFQRQVFQDWEGSVDRTLQESVDWLVRENMKLWRDTVERFHATTDPTASERLVGAAGREFVYNRDEIYSRIRGEAERRIETYNVEIESRKTIDAALQGVLQSFGLGAGALGLGYLVTGAFSSVAIDVTGLTAATMLLVSSFLILPYKRSKAKSEFARRIGELRTQLDQALRRESAAEIERIMQRISSAFEPYERFHQVEKEKVERFSERLASIEVAVRGLAADVDALATNRSAS
ncbi:MAG TPA: dynamin family protein [Thermoanaerobaculia bacterium]|nr:dynamin family protein [Thermoanaerobaculia bacterium]